MHTTFAPRVWDQVQVRGQSTNYPADLKRWSKFNKVFIKLKIRKAVEESGVTRFDHIWRNELFQ